MKKHLNYLNTLKKLAFKTFKLAAVSLAGVTLLAGILFLGLQTDYISQLFVLAVNKSFMQEKDLELGIRKIQGIVPFRFRIGELEIRDQSGRWASIKDSSINLSPFDLLKGRLSFSKFHIGELKIDRSLHIRKSEHENVPRGFRIPSIMDDLSIDNLQIASLRLGKDLVGKSINLSIRGDISNTENNEVQTLNLEIKGNDGYSGMITASVLLEGGSQSMDLKLSVHDPGKGILYSLTGMGEDFKLFVEGKGELSDWKGKLIVSGSDAGKITADIEVDSGRDYTLNVSGHFSPVEPLLKKYQLLTENGADFKLHGAITDEDEISLNLLEIDTGNSGAGFNGRIQLSNLESEGDFHLTVGDLSILEELFKKQVKGSLLLDGTLEGFLFNPLVELTYSIKEFGIDSIKSEEIRGSGIIDLQHEGSSGKTVNFSGDGNIYGLLLELKKSKYNQEKIGYRFNLSGKPKENLEINLFYIDSETLTAQASGNADISAGKLSLKGNLEIADPSELYPLKEGTLMGSGNLDFRIDADMSPVKVNTIIEGVYKPVPKDQFLKSLTGENIGFKGSAAFNGKEFEFSDIRIEALNASLESSGIYDPEEGADFSGSINIPDLGEVAGYRKKTLQGRAKAEYSINGILSSLEISASVDVKDFLWGEIRVAGASGEIAGTHTGQSDKGEISIELINDGYRIKSRSEFLLSGNKAALKNISISGADTEFAGNIDIDTRTPSVNGKLDFNSDDISSIAELLGKEMKGSASGEINFSSPAEKPDIEYSAFVQNLIFQKHSIKNIDLSGSISDISNDLEFKTQASLKDYTHEKIIMETVLTRRY